MSIVINSLNNSLMKLDQNTPCVTFSSNERYFRLGLYDGTQITNSHKWDGRIFYSYDKRNWYEWNGVITAPSRIIHLCGIDNTHLSYDVESSSTRASIHFFPPYNVSVDPGCDITCVGDLATLLDFRKYSSGGTLVASDYSFRNAFMGCLGLVSVQKIGFTHIGRDAFYGAFYECRDLKTPPALSAIALENSCYGSMFGHCYALECLPKLPAQNIPDYAYRAMFAYSNIKLSSSQTGEYQYPFRVPYSGSGTFGINALKEMVIGTQGTYTGDEEGTIQANTTYYTDKPLVE